MLFVVGAAAGLVLYHAAFGFTSSWRRFLQEGRGDGLRAQMLMLAATCLAFFPVLASGSFFGLPVRGFVSPVGVSVLTGAFLFGIGMQLGGGCASGTLYTAGGGNTRMLATLAAFIAGSVVGAVHVAWWETLPAFRPVSIVAVFGPASALALSFGLFGAIAALTIVVERRRHRGIGDGALDTPPASSVERTSDPIVGEFGGDTVGEPRGDILGGHRTRPGAGASRMWRGPWPLVAGALGLAAVNIATLGLAGRPWGVTSAFNLWGAKALAAAGVDVAGWTYWQPPARAAELHASVLRDVTSVMDIGLILGALLAAGLAGRFAPAWRVPARSLAAAVIGGLLLGYGARIAYGCNIGAYFSGIASGSAHGWVWLAAAMAGNAVGIRLRPLFHLSGPASTPQARAAA